MVGGNTDKATDRSAENDRDERHDEHLSSHLIAGHRFDLSRAALI
jgi:hypothetical protein